MTDSTLLGLDGVSYWVRRNGEGGAPPHPHISDRKPSFDVELHLCVNCIVLRLLKYTLWWTRCCFVLGWAELVFAFCFCALGLYIARDLNHYRTKVESITNCSTSWVYRTANYATEYARSIYRVLLVFAQVVLVSSLHSWQWWHHYFNLPSMITSVVISLQNRMRLRFVLSKKVLLRCRCCHLGKVCA